MDNNRKYRSVSGSTILMFIVVIVAALWMASRMQVHRQEVAYTDFVSEVESENVTDVYIDLNSAVPTGTVSFMLKDEGVTKMVNVSDVEKLKTFWISMGSYTACRRSRKTPCLRLCSCRL